MGLLNDFFSGNLDPDTKRGLLDFGLQMLANNSMSTGAAIGQSGLAMREMQQKRALEDYNKQVRSMQLQQMQRQQSQQAAQDRFREGLVSPQMQASQAALAGGGGPTAANAAQMPAVDPTQSMLFDAMKAGIVDPVHYITSTRKSTDPIKLGAGEKLLQPGTYMEVASNPKIDSPTAVREYQFAKDNGYSGSFEKWIKDKAAAGATRVNVPVSLSTEKKYGEQFAGEVAKSDMALKDAAEKAPELANRASRVKQLLNGGNAITGLGADFRLQASKALAAIGVKSSGNVAADTETLATQLASSTLDMIKASGLGGGTGFSNADRDFLEKAVGGKVTLEATTINRLADLQHRAASLAADRWNKRARQIPRSAIEGTGIDTSPLVIPTEQVPAASDGWSIRPR